MPQHVAEGTSLRKQIVQKATGTMKSPVDSSVDDFFAGLVLANKEVKQSAMWTLNTTKVSIQRFKEVLDRANGWLKAILQALPKDHFSREVQRLFTRLDLDASGTLDRHEVQAGFDRMGMPMTLEQVDEWLNQARRAPPRTPHPRAPRAAHRVSPPRSAPAPDAPSPRARRSTTRAATGCWTGTSLSTSRASSLRRRAAATAACAAAACAATTAVPRAARASSRAPATTLRATRRARTPSERAAWVRRGGRPWAWARETTRACGVRSRGGRPR